MEILPDFNDYVILSHKLLNHELEDEMRIYISGMISRSFDGNHLSSTAPFIAQDFNDLMTRIEMGKYEPSPNYYPFLVSLHTGEFYTTLFSKALDKEPAPVDFLKSCYDFASVYSRRMGKNYESHILKNMNENIEDYMKMMNIVFSFIAQNSEFDLSEKDYDNFKRFVKSRIFYQRPKIKKSEGNLLI